MSTWLCGVELDRRIPLPTIAGYLELTEAERAAVQRAGGRARPAAEPQGVAAMSDDDFDEREYLHTFLLRWGTAGKMPRFIIDGRKYDTSAAVRADLREAPGRCRASTSRPRST